MSQRIVHRRRFLLAIGSVVCIGGGGCGSRGEEAFSIRETPFALERSKMSAAEAALLMPALQQLSNRLDHAEITRYSDLVHAVRRVGFASRVGIVPTTATPDGTLLSILLNADIIASRFGSVHYANHHGICLEIGSRTPRVEGDSHPDKTLSVLAELEISAAKSFTLGQRDFAVQHLVTAACANFTWHQELAFSAVALLTYLAPASGWRNKHGEWCGFDRLLQQLTKSKSTGQACFGTHDLYAMAALLQVGRQSGWLQAKTEHAAQQRLQQAIKTLCESQSSDGSWTDGIDELSSTGGSEQRVGKDQLRSQIVATGHHLEWLQLVPFDELSNGPNLSAAQSFLVHACSRLSDSDIDQWQSPLAHVISALASAMPDQRTTPDPMESPKSE